MQTVYKDTACHHMSADNEPVITVQQGETVCFETEDCYNGNIQSTSDVFSKALWDTVNPATGPIAIDGARPGDTLKIDIKEIAITRNFAAMFVERGSGALANAVQGSETAILPMHNGRVDVSERLSLPAHPMVGVIGTAPAEGKILNGTPGEHGGNMDCKLITAGTSVYLPVNVAGALLALGDLHALMGDGEVCICGAEVPGQVTLQATVTTGNLPTPAVETATHYHIIASAESLDTCEQQVLAKSHQFLCRAGKHTANQAARLMSLACDLAVCQVVDPRKTMRFSIPKKLLA